MAVLLSLLTSVLFGTSDFCGGAATQRAKLIQVVALGHAVGLVAIFGASLILADEFRVDDFAMGAAAGAFGAVGLALLYRRLAAGPMNVVAPLTALLSAAVPSLWGVVNGEEISAIGWVGVALGLIAIGLVSSSSGVSQAPVTTRVIVETLIAGVSFGLMLIMLDATDPATAPWPIVGARCLTVGALLPFLLVTRQRIVPTGTVTIGLIAATGLLDTTANATFLYATNEGLLTLVAVLSAQYPVVTVVLARLVLSERMTRRQLWGFLAASLATTLIATA